MTLAARRGLPGASFIDPEVLARIGNLELLAKSVVEGFISGLHRAPHLGVSPDFAEHRPYMPGDDIRLIDWKVFARTDRFYVRLFEAETNTDFLVALDVTRSMRWGGGAVSKLDYGKFLAASLAWFSSRQRDRVGIATLEEDRIAAWVPPSARHLEILLHTIDWAPEPIEAVTDRRSRLRGALGRWTGGPAREGNPPAATAEELEGLREASFRGVLDDLTDRLRRRGIVVFISDFYMEPETARDGLALLRAKGQDVIAFHVLDPAELEFPFREATSFADLETGERLPIVPAAVRERYRELVTRHTTRLAELFAGAGIDYVLLDTSKPLDHALFEYLSMRQRLTKVR